MDTNGMPLVQLEPEVLDCVNKFEELPLNGKIAQLQAWKTNPKGTTTSNLKGLIRYFKLDVSLSGSKTKLLDGMLGQTHLLTAQPIQKWSTPTLPPLPNGIGYKLHRSVQSKCVKF